MPRYTVMYEIVETYDASIDVDSLDDLTDAVKQAHWSDEIDRSYRDGTVRVVDIWRVDDDGMTFISMRLMVALVAHGMRSIVDQSIWEWQKCMH